MKSHIWRHGIPEMTRVKSNRKTLFNGVSGGTVFLLMVLGISCAVSQKPTLRHRKEFVIQHRNASAIVLRGFTDTKRRDRPAITVRTSRNYKVIGYLSPGNGFCRILSPKYVCKISAVKKALQSECGKGIRYMMMGMPECIILSPFRGNAPISYLKCEGGKIGITPYSSNNPTVPSMLTQRTFNEKGTSSRKNEAVASKAMTVTSTSNYDTTDCPAIQRKSEKDPRRANALSSLIGLLCGALGTIIVMMIATRVKAGINRSRTTNSDDLDVPSMEMETEATAISAECCSDTMPSSDTLCERPSRKYYEILDLPANQLAQPERDYATIRSQQQLCHARTISGYEIPLERADLDASPIFEHTMTEIVGDPATENLYLETPATVPRYQNWNAEPQGFGKTTKTQ